MRGKIDERKTRRLKRRKKMENKTEDVREGETR